MLSKVENDLLRGLRKPLVLAAEANFSDRQSADWPDRAQFSRLINACASASCAEEIRNYLQYQCSRERPPWKKSFAIAVINRITTVLTEQHIEADELRVRAWQQYATYLARAFAYAMAIASQQDRESRRNRD